MVRLKSFYIVIALLVVTSLYSCINTKNKSRLVNSNIDNEKSACACYSHVQDSGPITGPICTDEDTIIGNYYLVCPGLVRIFNQIPSEQGMILRGGIKYKSRALKIFPAVFNFRLSEKNFFSTDTLKYSWKSDTIIWCNTPCNWFNIPRVYYEVMDDENPTKDAYYNDNGPDCVVFSCSDQIKCTPSHSSVIEGRQITHDAYIENIVTPEIEKILKEWNQSIIDSIFIKCEDYDWDKTVDTDPKNVYGRIIIKDGKLIDLKSIVTLDTTKRKQKKI